MDDKIIETIKQELNVNQQQNQEDSLFFKNKETIKINKENFHNYETKATKKLAFIDGGNAELINTPNLNLSFIRVYGIVLDNNKKIAEYKKEFYVLTTTRNKENNLIYQTKIFNQEENLDYEINSFDNSIKQGNNRANVSIIPGIIRRFTEVNLAIDISKQTQDTIIVLDGSLKANYPKEQELINELYQTNNIIVALSKTSNLLTKNGKSLITYIMSMAPNEKWYYYPLIESNEPYIIIAKLNSKSRYAFKIETNNKQNIKEIIENLANNSNDPIFPGYPYGLIVADKFARVPNDEKEYIKTILTTKLKSDISSHLNPLNAHSILDNIG